MRRHTYTIKQNGSIDLLSCNLFGLFFFFFGVSRRRRRVGGVGGGAAARATARAAARATARAAARATARAAATKCAHTRNTDTTLRDARLCRTHTQAHKEDTPRVGCASCRRWWSLDSLSLSLTRAHARETRVRTHRQDTPHRQLRLVALFVPARAIVRARAPSLGRRMFG
jgi:hypothetical protein